MKIEEQALYDMPIDDYNQVAKGPLKTFSNA